MLCRGNNRLHSRIDHHRACGNFQLIAIERTDITRGPFTVVGLANLVNAHKFGERNTVIPICSIIGGHTCDSRSVNPCNVRQGCGIRGSHKCRPTTNNCKFCKGLRTINRQCCPIGERDFSNCHCATRQAQGGKGGIACRCGCDSCVSSIAIDHVLDIKTISLCYERIIAYVCRNRDSIYSDRCCALICKACHGCAIRIECCSGRAKPDELACLEFHPRLRAIAQVKFNGLNRLCTRKGATKRGATLRAEIVVK